MKELTKKQQLAQLQIPFAVFQAYVDKVNSEVHESMKNREHESEGKPWYY